ncbi:MAG: hypothetical protein BroJett014_08800 [Planctomycetota bacterium]|nr:MAG: hypothetical protein BroJett014_08800 [Planctomycetota bacterium]
MREEVAAAAQEQNAGIGGNHDAHFLAHFKAIAALKVLLVQKYLYEAYESALQLRGKTPYQRRALHELAARWRHRGLHQTTTPQHSEQAEHGRSLAAAPELTGNRKKSGAP